MLYRALLTRFCISWICDFLESECSEAGSSFWRDHQYREFSADIGAGYGFLEALASYLDKILEEKANEKLS